MICTLQYLLVWLMCGSKHLYSSAYVICHPLFLQLIKKNITKINYVHNQLYCCTNRETINELYT